MSLPTEESVDQEIAAREGSPEGHAEFDRLVRTIWRLRRPEDGCPWDKAQTNESITKNMIEEAYEAVEAILDHDDEHLVEELGDVLEQVLLHSQIAQDEGRFGIDDVCRGLNQKLIRRHPHIFGDYDDATSADSEGAVLDIWDDVKKAERASKGEGGMAEPGLLDSVPRSLPALMQAQKVSKRAAKAGFEWESIDDVWDKVAEERLEFEAEEPGSDAAAEEFGDILFALVNVARHAHVDAEEALSASTRKFRRRWAYMEATCRRRGVDIDSIPLAQQEELWQEAKRQEREGL